MNAFVRFNEYASRTDETCQTVNSDDFKLLVENDRARYINALREIERQHKEWLECTRELASLLRLKTHKNSDNQQGRAEPER